MASTLPQSVRVKLSVMMFLQYAYYGVWIVPFASFLQHNSYTGIQISNIIGNTAIAFILAPLFVCVLTDKFFRSDRVLAILNILGAIFLFLAAYNVTNISGMPQPFIMWWLILIHCLCYTPTWALTNNITMRQMSNPDKDFSSIRIMGTLGWIAISAIALFSSQIKNTYNLNVIYENSNIPLLIGGCIGILSGIWALLLPPTPPEAKTKQTQIKDIFGLSALKLLRHRNFLIIAIISLLAGITDIYYWAWGNMYLTELGIKSAPFVMSLGQVMELLALFIIGKLLVKLRTKKILLLGLIISILRFALLSFAHSHATWLIYFGVPLHGAFFVFIVITTQIYTNNKSPKELLSSAQGLLSMLTFGLGWFFGAQISGKIVNHYQTGLTAHNWTIIWTYPIILLLSCLILLIAFKDSEKK